ncbi:SERTA domain-containing protein 3 isoform X1 [Centropristis striata]|uniref:SERTA domain-containing protein 3 isoform X1 n=1 Tax=Centropristis striata TaxID=184440 RepID=UPI0027DF1FE8|nr:SERTA domain-containing protein 3 isoform X1 [Centropristis striata]XP_059188189.1 SERTA domain-containing protein 3 isoform X1 [Centropristis striata]XP_059188190.1 SERTA domain-containing protein 3 isoform X1 [Centropristis striata]XP_059188191.1 SERTA domain-containing protein 3 isoform X1 [Centropristis striata]XP_059188192.1 SERTA domain-containing protein 3 isoform X1 [Centropristis striata]
MIMKGQKRKHPPEDVETDLSNPTWEIQRQFVFSVSLNKYQRGQELPEPSLRRSVLIANTLRQVSMEACRFPSVDMEVSQPGSSSSSAQHHSAVTFANSHSALLSDPLVSSNPFLNCATGRSAANCHLNASDVPLTLVKDEDEDWGSLSTDSDFSISAAISSILTALDSTIDGSPQAAPRTPLRSLENLSGPSDGGAAWLKQGVRGYGGGWEQQEEWRARESSMEVMRSSYLSELTVEDLFQDIDTSLLEKDMGVLGLRGSGDGYPTGDDLLRYLPPLSSPSSLPFSFSLNQNLKCLPSFSSFSPLSSSTSSSSSLPSPPFSSQNHVREGLELEHLMEILVES